MAAVLLRLVFCEEYAHPGVAMKLPKSNGVKSRHREIHAPAMAHAGPLTTITQALLDLRALQILTGE
jgi:hypothetical protein